MRLLLLIIITAAGCREGRERRSTTFAKKSLQGYWIHSSQHSSDKLNFKSDSVEIIPFNGKTQRFSFTIKKDSLFIADADRSKYRFYFIEKDWLYLEFAGDSIHIFQIKYRRVKRKN